MVRVNIKKRYPINLTSKEIFTLKGKYVLLSDVKFGKIIIEHMYCTYPPLNTLSIHYHEYLFDESLQLARIEELSSSFWMLYMKMIKDLIGHDLESVLFCIRRAAGYFSTIEKFQGYVLELFVIPFYMTFKGILNNMEMSVFQKVNRWMLDHISFESGVKKRSKNNTQYKFLRKCAINEFMFQEKFQSVHDSNYMSLKPLLTDSSRHEQLFHKAISYLESMAVKLMTLANVDENLNLHTKKQRHKSEKKEPFFSKYDLCLSGSRTSVCSVQSERPPTFDIDEDISFEFSKIKTRLNNINSLSISDLQTPRNEVHRRSTLTASTSFESQIPKKKTLISSGLKRFSSFRNLMKKNTPEKPKEPLKDCNDVFD